MDQLAQFYREGLVEAVIFLLLVLLAFGSITIVARERWARLGLVESLLCRLGTAAVLGSIAVGGLSGIVLNLVYGAAFSDTTLTPTTARNQAGLGVGLALAVTVVGIIRIEMYHRGVISPPVEQEPDWKLESKEATEWKAEPPEMLRRP